MERRSLVLGMVIGLVGVVAVFVIGGVMHPGVVHEPGTDAMDGGGPGSETPGEMGADAIDDGMHDDGFREEPGDGWYEPMEDEVGHGGLVSLHELSPVASGEALTGGNCEGSGAGVLTHPPMDMEDVAVIIPYGSTTGAHVTPIDHQYFYPNGFEEGDLHPVYAMSNGTIYKIDYSPPSQVEDTGMETGDYGVYIALSCTHMYYETLLNELSPRLQRIFEEERDRDVAEVSVPVTAGERIAMVGGRTIDFAVLDTEKPLQHFISPELYAVEQSKIFTADPFDYSTEELTETLLEKYPRSAEPLGGRIDYDVEGKLRGNWFIEGMNGYRGGPLDAEPSPTYWMTHLSIYPDHFDPGATIISVGNFSGESAQLATPRDSPDPATVGVGDGLIRYRLHDLEHVDGDGSGWDGFSAPDSLRVKPFIERGCALFEMPENHTLHAEFFPNESCDDVEGFTGRMRVYER